MTSATRACDLAWSRSIARRGADTGGALFAQAIEDALDLPSRGVELNAIPLSPSDLWELINPFPVRDLNAVR